MAGNWKMNLNHQEAVVAGPEARLDLADKKHDYAEAEVVGVPPFTDLRSVQTLVDGDRLPIRYGAQDVSTHDSGAYTGEISAGDAGQARAAPTSSSGTPSGGSTTRRPTTLVNAKAHKALAAGMTPIVCVGEGLDVRQAGEQVPAHAGPGRRLAGRLHRRAGRRRWSSPTSRSGRSAPARWPRPTTRRRSAARSEARLRESARRRGGGRPYAILYGGSVKAANVAGIMAKADVDGCSGRRREPAGGRVRRDLPVLRHADL